MAMAIPSHNSHVQAQPEDPCSASRVVRHRGHSNWSLSDIFFGKIVAATMIAVLN
jgi:hypothetical protein